MLKMVWLILILVVANAAFATMFFPLPLEKQIDEATSAAEVKLMSSRVFRNSSGVIMTEYNFDVLEAYNLSSADLDQNRLTLIMPGGTLDGVSSMVDGAPVFLNGDKNFLLLKKVDSKIYLSNFTLGKYKIQSYQGKDYYVSEVFPMDQNIGRISKEKMIGMIKEKWKISSVSRSETARPFLAQGPRFKEKFPVFEKRAPAQESAVTEEIPVFFWGALILVSLFFGLIFIKLEQSGQSQKRE